MSKYSQKEGFQEFERVQGDFYPTPMEAVYPLFPFLPANTKFIEPCAGDGRLINHLESRGHECIYACDIEPRGPNIERRDVLFFGQSFPPCDLILTNPPWERDALHKMISTFTDHADTWLLFDADWMHTKQASPFRDLCRKVVAIGRVSWFGGTTGTENACWYLFSKNGTGTEFHFQA